MIDAVAFDLDGTLVNLPIDYDTLFAEFSKIMMREDVQPITETIPRLDMHTKKKVFEVWTDAELAALKDMTANDEGMTLYRKYPAKPKALVTMQGREPVRKILRTLSLLFNLTVTREDSLDRVDQLKIAAQGLKVQFEKMLFIGNTEGDLRAAQKVKCQFLKVGP